MMFSSPILRRSALVMALASGAALMPFSLHAQVTGSTTTTTDSQGKPQTNVSMSAQLPGKKKKKEKVKKEDRVQQTKDTKKEIRKQDKYNPLLKKDATLPDKQLYDKALLMEKKGHFDVARLDLQTLLNTYPDSQYQMRAKLAIADSWYQEGGSAALAQAEQEYKDFITFFPNVPEAAEAQMRVGDIYFKQMDVPDRDYAKAISAETEYRTMLKQYPDAPPAILKQARQKLRDVQEVLATREAEIAAFYAGHANWAASIARYQTVVDTYPQYSHMDDVLIGIGDAYATQAAAVRARPVCAPGVKVACLTEASKSKLEQTFDTKATAAYTRVVVDHSAAPHAEDAKERLAALNMPIPTPTPEQAAASEALEGSRAQYDLRNRLELLIFRKPDTVTAAQVGDPPLEDAPATTAPTVAEDITRDYEVAINPNAKPLPAAKPVVAADAPADAAPADVAPPVSAAPPTLSDVPAAGSENTSGTSTEMAPAATSGGTETGVGATIVSTGGGTPASSLPAATGAADENYGLKTVKPKTDATLAPVEAPAEAPDQVNEANGKSQPAAEQKADGKKKDPKPEFDKGDESSSKHKPKKGLKKINPF
ncbi:MAG: outer membrane protein assembly factor BamD [Acidobacteriaceae bacterium]|nr:outer membrane protein assembly factor BamD [Acidobacteriaceae bacterium]